MKSYPVEPATITDHSVAVPGSKSVTHRMLIAAALSDGQCTVAGPLRSEDTGLTAACLQQFGAGVQDRGADIVVSGIGGRWQPVAEPIHLGNSGTSVRLLTAVAALGKGPYLLTGARRMQQRPIGPLLDSLRQMGVTAATLNRNGCPPLQVSGGALQGGRIGIDCRISSQFLSALLLIAPFAAETLTIDVTHGPVSRPYVDVTLKVMAQYGIQVERSGYRQFVIQPDQFYQAGDYTVEPDVSQASYFWAAAAISGGAVKVSGTSPDTVQGDIGFVECLQKMGCRRVVEPDGIKMIGGPLHGITVDMADMPDVVPTLAVVAAFAEGTTVIENVAHLRDKESDRLAAVACELSKMGVDVECGASALTIRGGAPRGAAIDTYDDHRIAMSFAVAGLKTPGVRIKDPDVVGKSFPDFWQVFNTLYA